MVVPTLSAFPFTAVTWSGSSGSLSGPEPLSANTFETPLSTAFSAVVKASFCATPGMSGAAMTVALAVLLAAFGSNWSASLMVPVLVCAAGLTTRAVMLSVCETRALTVPAVHTPLTLL